MSCWGQDCWTWVLARGSCPWTGCCVVKVDGWLSCPVPVRRTVGQVRRTVGQGFPVSGQLYSLVIDGSLVAWAASNSSCCCFHLCWRYTCIYSGWITMKREVRFTLRSFFIQLQRKMVLEPTNGMTTLSIVFFSLGVSLESRRCIKGLREEAAL